jgi:hypothetical protein
MYFLLGVLFILVVLREIGSGPEGEATHAPVREVPA